jgi:hypothetical protein
MKNHVRFVIFAESKPIKHENSRLIRYVRRIKENKREKSRSISAHAAKLYPLSLPNSETRASTSLMLNLSLEFTMS